MKSKKINSFLFHFAFKVVKWLVISTDTTAIPLALFETLANRFQSVLDHNGPLHTIKYVKAVRSNFYNYLSGNILRDPLARCTKDGIPIVFGDLIPLVRRGDKRVIALLLTLLSATRALRIKSQPDLTSITQPANGEVPDISKYMGDFWKTLGYRPCIEYNPRLRGTMNLYRLSNGPNGHALNSALEDARLIPKDLFNDIMSLSDLVGSYLHRAKDSFVQDFWKPSQVRPIRGTDNPQEEGRDKVSDIMDELYRPHKNRESIRRVSSFADKEGKQRTVGILDYYSQAALKPLHTYLARALSKIRQDCTHDQGKFARDSGFLNSEVFYSVDLSAATDRFPIKVISKLLKTQLPDSYVSAWERVMVGYPFDSPIGKISYAVGNPMGAYSSFNSFALTHHYIIYYCCRELNKPWKRLNYYLLGDDIVIGDKDVGELYMKVIKTLGVEYSLAKTHRSVNFFEFAKRVFYHSEEITPFPVSALKECGKSVSAFTILLKEQSNKGWNFMDTVSSVETYFGLVKSLPSKFVTKLGKKSWYIEGVLELVQGQPLEHIINKIHAKMEPPRPPITAGLAKMIISQVSLDAFAKSHLGTYFQYYDNNKVPLFRRIIALRTKWDQAINQPGIKLDFSLFFHPAYFNSLPVVCAMHAVSEEFNRMQEGITKANNTGAEWSYYLRNIALPTSDKSLLDKSNFRVSRSVSSFATLLEKRLQFGIVPMGGFTLFPVEAALKRAKGVLP